MPDPNTLTGAEPIEPNAENKYEVTRADLPLHCPMPGMSLWNSHPRVYLEIEKTGQELIISDHGIGYAFLL